MAEQTETILTWNVTNWVTVLIMVAVGFTVLAITAQIWHNRKGASASKDAAQ